MNGRTLELLKLPLICESITRAQCGLVLLPSAKSAPQQIACRYLAFETNVIVPIEWNKW